ncbi:HD domain-containing protein [Candidatus Dojkabacteria bacterium]|jgi:HD superfamily phosphohydrolase YqeK|nr:HD domain-containing protein [Candidatus Dojkabacteria bacterium]
MEIDEKKVIELGKILMKKSINKTHDFEHAQNTVNHALKIYPQFGDLDRNMVEIAGWWHDCYKSITDKDTLGSILSEGVKSEKMFNKEVGDMISPERKQIIGQAIRRHNNFLWMIFNKKGMSNLDIVLYEADQLDQFNDKREEKGRAESKSFFVSTFLFFLLPFLRKILKITAVSTYTKNKLKEF